MVQCEGRGVRVRRPLFSCEEISTRHRLVRRTLLSDSPRQLLAGLAFLAITPDTSRAELESDRRGRSVIARADDLLLEARPPSILASESAARARAGFLQIDPAAVSSRVSHFGHSFIDGFIEPPRAERSRLKSLEAAPARPATPTKTAPGSNVPADCVGGAASAPRGAAGRGCAAAPPGAIASAAPARIGAALLAQSGRQGVPVMRNRDALPDRNLDEVAPAPPPIAPAAPVNPYEAAGIATESFVFKPALEIAAGFDSNPGRRTPPRGSPVVMVFPELSVRSQFERHQLNADIRAGFIENAAVQNTSRPSVEAKVDGRYDLTDATTLNAEGRFALDALITPGFRKNPLVSVVGGSVGAVHKFGPAEIAVRGSLDRIMFTKGRMANNKTLNTRDRNYTQPSAQLRASYALTPEVSPFVHLEFDRRLHDLRVDFNGLRRDSTGVTARVGAAVNFGQVVGDASVGYLSRRLDGPQLRNVRGVVADATLAWAATETTTFVLVARSQSSETPAPNISGILSRDAIVQADHRFEPWLSGTLRAGFGLDRFFGTTRVDQRYFVGAASTYKFSRFVHFKGDVRAEWTHSNAIGNFMTVVALFGLRLQY
jgi:hypothetical protein